jgi:heme exporter protein D
MTDFLAMGGYALWVWSAFGLAVVVLVANVVMAQRRYHDTVRRLRLRMNRAGGIRP